MPYGPLHSPSLNKMNGHMDSYSGGARHRRGGRMSMGNILGDPFALATISIALLAWIIALIGQIIENVNGEGSFPNYAWIVPAWMLFCIIGVIVIVASNSSTTYGVAMVGYLAIGVVVTTSAANGLIYKGTGAGDAASAGNIVLAMICIVWIFYFGSTPSAVSRAYLDSFALNKDPAPMRSSRGMSHGGYSNRPDTSISSHNNAPQMYTTSAQLNGFETSSPVQSGFNHTGNGINGDRSSSQPRFGSSNLNTSSNNMGSSNANMSSDPVAGGGLDGGVVAPTEYPYRAKAIYSYEANPEDANEISFSKHEILEVSDVSGRWWQAKKASGQTGIAPSNYLILL